MGFATAPSFVGTTAERRPSKWPTATELSNMTFDVGVNKALPSTRAQDGSRPQTEASERARSPHNPALQTAGRVGRYAPSRVRR